MNNQIQVSSIGKLSEVYNENPVLQSLLQLIPGWSSADTLLKHRAIEMHTERVSALFEELANGRRKITEEVIQSNEFLHCYFKTVRAVLGTKRSEKIKMFARLLKSVALDSLLDEVDDFEEALSALDELSYREFSILSLLRSFEVKASGIHAESEIARIGTYWEEFKGEVRKILKNPASFEPFMARIERTGLYLRITGSFFNYSGDCGQTTSLFSHLCDLISEEDSENSEHTMKEF